MLWNGAMLGLGFASLDGSIVVPVLAWLAIGSLAARALEETSGVWKALED